MLSFAAPLWLCGLLSLPVIRWLHRRSPPMASRTVARIAWWRNATAGSARSAGPLLPDPAWRRRALLVALLCVALAGPRPEVRDRDVTVWIDDSLSMLLREPGGSRLEQALAVATAEADASGARTELRTTSDPWRKLGPLTAASGREVVAHAGREPAALPAGLLQANTENWLVTDGADSSLLAWVAGQPPDRVLRVGGPARNVGLERLAARRSLTNPDRYELLVKITNGGSETEARDVVFTVATPAATREVGRSTLHLKAGEAAWITATAPEADQARASLQPSDALPEDDGIALDLSLLRRPSVRVDPACPAPLVTALRTHPGIFAVGTGDAAEAIVSCTSGKTAQALPTIRIVGDGLPEPLRGPLQWSAAIPDRERIANDPGALRSGSALEVGTSDRVLLAADGRPLVVERTATPRRIDVALDFGAAAAARDPIVPLLANVLLERVLDRRLLDATVEFDRGPRAVLVAPAPPPVVAPPPEPGAARASALTLAAPPARDDVTRLLLVAAMALLVWELIAVARLPWSRARTGAAAETGPR